MAKSLHSRRVFIGIKMSDALAGVCMRLQQEFADLPARFTKREDLHQTLVPPFDMVDQGLVDSVIRPIVERTRSFELQLKRLEYGPSPDEPRLAWIECEPAKELVELRQSLVDAFEYKDRYSFRPHVTLARFNDQDQHVLKDRSIGKEVDAFMKVASIELFESVHQDGVTYKLLRSYGFSF